MIEIIPNFHPIFVHFTIALFTTSFLLFLAGSSLHSHQWSETMLKAAHVNLWIGAIFTIFTLLAGWDAYNTVSHDGPSHAAMTDHRNWALVTAAVWAILAFWSLKYHRKIARVSIPFLALLFVAWGLLMTTGYKGGEIVYRYGLGVMAMPLVVEDGSHGSHPHDGMEEPIQHPMPDSVAEEEAKSDKQTPEGAMPTDNNENAKGGPSHHDSVSHEH
ncbi:MAG TPA: DUF2231 domain-containing protein [Alphaproteobacteria bacterium]|nr:hypothetical protein [Rhodospirillaceae bacterium]HRJ12025.1 DUF2231 domain-containing protein [Alphaproteobacteria bacterium]